MTNYTNHTRKPLRALVLQGGGSLGAYEAGVFKAIYLKEEHDPITSVLKYLKEIINKIDEYLPGNPQVATLLIDELTKFHESLKCMSINKICLTIQYDC